MDVDGVSVTVFTYGVGFCVSAVANCADRGHCGGVQCYGFSVGVCSVCELNEFGCAVYWCAIIERVCCSMWLGGVVCLFFTVFLFVACCGCCVRRNILTFFGSENETRAHNALFVACVCVS